MTQGDTLPWWKHEASIAATTGLIKIVRHWATQQEQTETHLPESICSLPVSVRQYESGKFLTLFFEDY